MERHAIFSRMVLTLLIGVSYSFALTPLESIILGDFTNRYEEKSSDPLDYIFQIETIKDQRSNRNFKEALALYRGFYLEGKNLENFCTNRPEIVYSKPFDRVQSKRSVVATLQYIGLDIAVRSIPQYAKFFEFSRDEYKNLVDGLVGNYCSQNVSLISLKQLKNNFMVKFDKENTFELPSIEGNPLFPKKMRNFTTIDKAKEREFQQTIKLFQSFCSWGGDVDDLRLLIPLIRHSGVMAFIIRQISNRRLEWQELDNKILLSEDLKTSQVLCENLICRKTDNVTFNEKIPKGVGSTSIQEDMNRLYCQSLRDSDFVNKGQEPKIAEIFKQMSFDDQNLMVSQFIALITKFPDFIVRAEKLTDAKEFIRSSMDLNWDDWAKSQNERLDKDLTYEESLTIELVERKVFYNRFVRDFKVVFDVNLGEFDRINQIIGKISTHFEIKVSPQFLKWVRREWVEVDPRIKDARKKIVDRFKKIIRDDVVKAKSKMPIKNWRGDLEGIIVEEILGQLADFRGRFYDDFDKGLVTIPVQFNYSPFALKYLNFLHKVERNRELKKKTPDIAKTP